MQTPVPISEAFGKLDRHFGQAWHPLVDHLADVAAVFELLCDCKAPRRALEATAGRPLDQQDIARLSALVFLHDLGKANAGFQAKRWRDEDRPRAWLTAGHGIEAIALLDSAIGDSNEALSLLLRLPIEAMSSWGTDETVGGLLRASIAHHGRPLPNPPDWFNARTHWVAHQHYHPAEQLARIGEALLRFVPSAFEQGGEPLPDAPRFAHCFAGLVQLADWLGSDTRFFKFSEPGEDRLTTSRKLARQAVQDIGLDAEPYRDYLTNHPPAFGKVFDAPAPYPAQAAMAYDTLGPVVVLEAETGSGKT